MTKRAVFPSRFAQSLTPRKKEPPVRFLFCRYCRAGLSFALMARRAYRQVCAHTRFDFFQMTGILFHLFGMPPAALPSRGCIPPIRGSKRRRAHASSLCCAPLPPPFPLHGNEGNPCGCGSAVSPPNTPPRPLRRPPPAVFSNIPTHRSSPAQPSSPPAAFLPRFQRPPPVFPNGFWAASALPTPSRALF